VKIVISIGDLARRTGVKVPTIRYYEQMGLVTPPDRTDGNQRRYGRADIERLSFIRHARDLGFSLDAVRDLLRLAEHPERSCADADEIAARHLATITAKIAKLTRLEAELRRFAACKADTISDCAVIESLADHALCHGEH